MIPGFVPSAAPVHVTPPVGDPPQFSYAGVDTPVSRIWRAYTAGDNAQTDVDTATVSFWVNTSSWAQKWAVTWGAPGGGDGFYFGLQGSGYWAYQGVNAGTPSQSTRYPNLNTWYHIVLNLSSGLKPTIYEDGADITASFSISNQPPQADMPGQNGDRFTVGASSYTTATIPWFPLIYDVHYVDGQTLPPTAFGTGTAGVNGSWYPAYYAAQSWGGRGANYRFENAGNLGEDSSPNGYDLVNEDGTPAQSAGIPPQEP